MSTPPKPQTVGAGLFRAQPDGTRLLELGARGGVCPHCGAAAKCRESREGVRVIRVYFLASDCCIPRIREAFDAASQRYLMARRKEEDLTELEDEMSALRRRKSELEGTLIQPRKIHDD